MNQIFAGSIAFILALVLWLIGKKPQNNLKKISQKKLLHLNNLNNPSLTKENPKEITQFHSNQIKEFNWQPPITAKEKISLKRKLFSLIQLGPRERLEAILIATKWGDSCAISILRRGLKDSDRKVVIAAAKAIEKYKKSPSLLHSKPSLRLPLNIFLMR
tara:strand:- start:4419 stop:4898 length:480 start_codon:yes stop_codon:yes gene_type:complete